MNYRCPLGKLIRSDDSEQIKRNGWVRDGILVVSIDDERLDFVQREEVRQLALHLYGQTTKGR